jgi:Na+/H+-dicarboxylate symporter
MESFGVWILFFIMVVLLAAIVLLHFFKLRPYLKMVREKVAEHFGTETELEARQNMVESREKVQER